MLSDTYMPLYAERHYAEYRYAKCRGTVVAPTNSFTAQAPNVIKAIIPPKNWLIKFEKRKVWLQTFSPEMKIGKILGIKRMKGF